MSLGLKELATPIGELAVGLAAGTLANVGSAFLTKHMRSQLPVNLAVSGAVSGAALYITQRYALTKLPNTTSGLMFFAVGFIVSQQQLLGHLKDASEYIINNLPGVVPIGAAQTVQTFQG